MNKPFPMSAVRIAGYVGGIAILLSTAASAYANTGTINIQSVSPGNSIPVGTQVTFSVVPTGFNTNPKYSLSDSFHNGSLGSYDLNSAGVFSWTPFQNDVGTHSLAIVVTDNSGNAATANYTLTVTPTGTTISNSTGNTTSSAPVSLSLSAVSPSSTVNVGQAVTVSAAAVGFSGTPIYSVFDSSEASSITSSNVSSNGVFSWTPQTNDAGTHLITFSATDTTGRIATSTAVVFVQSAAGTSGTTATQTTTTASSPTFTADLALGSNDPQVALLQQILTAQGDLTVAGNGHFGPATQAAVIKFQAANNIAQLGIVGPSTRAALNALQSPAPASTTSTASTSVVSQIQAEIQTVLTQIQQIESQLASL